MSDKQRRRPAQEPDSCGWLAFWVVVGLGFTFLFAIAAAAFLLPFG